MAIGKTMRKEIVEWGILAMVIVIISVVLLKFKDISGVTATLNTTIDTIITGLSEPANWILIVVIGLIGFALIKLFTKTTKS
jgi:uncharacterized Tic20 family protein